MRSHGLARIRAFGQRHPRWADAGVTAVVALVCTPYLVIRDPVDAGSTSDAVGAIDWAAHGALLLPLLWRRRAPVLVFWTIFGLVTVSGWVDADIPAQAIVPAVAVYTVARHRPRWQLATALTGMLVALVLAKLGGDLGWGDLAGLIAFFVAAALLGVTISTRTAYLAELEERARRLERERDHQTQLAAAAERARIAREMHDIVAHNLAVMIALADGATYAAGQAPDRAADAMRQVSNTGREAMAEMRRLLGLLREDDPPDRDDEDGEGGEREPQPGLDDIDRLVDQIRAAGVEVTVSRKGTPGPWGQGAGLAIYRIVQEALTNTLKHAGAGACVDLTLRYTASAAAISVLDDGANRPARPAPSAENGHGLAGMSERAASYDGVVRAGRRRGSGWYVHARLRFDQAAVP
jgi:signal transduction histidine kinase